MAVRISKRAWNRQFASPQKADRGFARRLPHIHLPAFAPIIPIAGSMIVGAALATAIPRVTGVESDFEWIAGIVAESLQRDEPNSMRSTPELWQPVSESNWQKSHIASSFHPMDLQQ